MQNYTLVILTLLCALIPLVGRAQLERAAQYQPDFTPVKNGESLYPTTPVTPTGSSSSRAVLDTIFYEDFADGFEDWTITQTIPADTSLWVVGTDSLGGFYSSGAFESPTAANGYAVINYDLYNTNGENLAGVIRPIDSVSQALTSPSFSTTDVAGERLGLLFYQNYRYCCNPNENTVKISFSSDGGATFNGDTVVNPTLFRNISTTGFTLLEIPAAYAGREDIQVRFTYNNSFYLWAIDDISVVVYPDVQLQVDDFHAIAPNILTPSSQTDSIFFLSDVQNTGQVDQNVKLVITIERIDSETLATTIFTDTLDYSTIEAQTLVENRNFGAGYPMPKEIGSYRGTYSIVSPQLADDPFTNNNIKTFAFRVTESTFSKAASRTGASRPILQGSADTRPEYEVGNIYMTPALAQGDTVRIDSIFFGGAGQGFGDNAPSEYGVLTVKAYGYRGDINNDTIPNFGGVDNDEAEFVELGVYEIELDSTFSADSLYSVPILTDDGGAAFITSNDGYVGFATAIRYTAAGGTNNGNDLFFVAIDGEISYVATDLATRQSGSGNQRFTDYSVVEGRAIPAGFGAFGNPVLIGARIQSTVGVVSTSELSEVDFRVSPNPATTSFVVQYPAENNAASIEIEIRNALGQLVKSIPNQFVGVDRLTISTESLNNGLYYVVLKTLDGETGTRKLYINR